MRPGIPRRKKTTGPGSPFTMHSASNFSSILRIPWNPSSRKNSIRSIVSLRSGIIVGILFFWSRCENFVVSSDWNADTQMFRTYEVQYHIESSLALWHCRYSRWEGALTWKEQVSIHGIWPIDLYMYVSIIHDILSGIWLGRDAQAEGNFVLERGRRAEASGMWAHFSESLPGNQEISTLR